MNNDGAVGAAVLIRNDPGSENEFRMMGNVQIGDNYIEIVPVLTREDAEKKRSPGTYHSVTEGPFTLQ